MNETIRLSGSKILVTGATGFIGGRLVDYLVAHPQTQVQALVRSYGRAVRLACYPVNLIPGDLLEVGSLQQAVAGCDVVFHCAYSASGDDETRRSIIVDGTKNLLAAAVAAKVKRFVYLSTMAVHGPDPGPVIDENTPLAYTGNVYSDAKIEAEKLVLQAMHTHGLPVVMLRPTIVYGPYSDPWTLGPLQDLQRGRLTLIEGGQGIANHVYVDDVIQAMLAAAVRPEATGETFAVSYGTGVTWKEFFGYYARMTGLDLPDLSIQAIEEQHRLQAQLRNPLYMGLSFVASPRAQTLVHQAPGLGPAMTMAERLIPAAAKQAIVRRATALRTAKLNPPHLPKPAMIEFYCARPVCKIDKARRLLGYEPHHALAAGMQLTEFWLRDERRL